MTSKTLEQKVEKLKLKVRETQALIIQQQRKDETRRKILLGAFLLNKIENGNFTMRDEFFRYLNEKDRRLFDYLTTGQNV